MSIFRNRDWCLKLPQLTDRFKGIGGADSYTKLLIHGNPPSGSSAFLDATTNLHPIQAVNSMVSTSAQSTLGLGSSALFTSATGQYLVLPDSADWTMGSGDFTIDFCFRMNGLPAAGTAYYLLAQYAGANDYWYIRVNHPNTGPIATFNATPTFGGTTGYTANQIINVETGDTNGQCKVKTVVGGVVTVLFTAPQTAGDFYSTGAGQATDPSAGSGDLTVNVATITAGNHYYLQFVSVAGGITQVSNYVLASLTTATWYHYALVRSSSTWSQYQGGSLVGTATTSSYTMPDLAGSLYIGSLSTTTTNSMNGWINELRISKGIARWTANFTPPVTLYTIKSW